MSSLRRGHDNLLFIVPILVYVLPKQAQQWLFLKGKIYLGNPAAAAAAAAAKSLQSCLTLCDPIDSLLVNNLEDKFFNIDYVLEFLSYEMQDILKASIQASSCVVLECNWKLQFFKKSIKDSFSSEAVTKCHLTENTSLPTWVMWFQALSFKSTFSGIM